MRVNIFDWLVEYWHTVAVCGVIIYLLINKSTRKITFKVLCGIFLIMLTMCVIIVGCVWIFGDADGLLMGVLVIFNLGVLVMAYISIGELYRVVRLNKKGVHVYGTLISRAAGRGASRVVYRVDGKKYKCESTSQLNRYEIGCDKVPVIYDAENHGNSCIEKYDFIQSAALFITYGILETGMVILTVYFCFVIFS